MCWAIERSVIPGQSLQPQTATQKEAGVKFAGAGGHAIATLSVFDIKETNRIEEVGITGVYEQIGAVQSRGAELERPLKAREDERHALATQARCLKTSLRQIHKFDVPGP